MPSETEIASNALTKLGAQSITSIADDDTQRARLCRSYYPNVRDAALRAYPWRCATVRRNLAVEDDTPVGDDWAHQFQLPVDAETPHPAKPVTVRVVELLVE